MKSGTFTIPTTGHDFSGNTRYRITLTVRDSSGLTTTKSVTIWPRKVNLTFDTAPSGLTLYLDGIAKTTPFVYDTLVGFHHTIEARDQTRADRQRHVRVVVRRRDASHTLVVPATDQRVHGDVHRHPGDHADRLRPGRRGDTADRRRRSVPVAADRRPRPRAT